MIGNVSIVVKDKRNNYSFTLHRNITILCGESGRGKTTLYEMISDFNQYGTESSVKIVCDKSVLAISGKNWKDEIEMHQNAVIVIDEDNQFIRSAEFAQTIKNSSNYFLLITRSYLEQLPYSVDEIYEVVGEKNKKFKKKYVEVNRMYSDVSKKDLPFVPDIIITEDSKAGHQFFLAIAQKYGIECFSAEGKSNIAMLLEKYKNKKVLAVADGAAFGAEIADVIKIQDQFPKHVAVFLPESFEWLILKAGLVNDKELEKVVAPEKYVDSQKYFSWERYFTELLVDITKNMGYKKYPKNKNKLPEFYIHEKSVNQIMGNMQGVEWIEQML